MTRRSRKSRARRADATRTDGLMASGLTELTLRALSGWPVAIASTGLAAVAWRRWLGQR